MPPVIYRDHRGNRLPSVTTIIGRFKESGGLLYWANQQGLEGKTLGQARAEVTTPGTLAHKAVEDHINGRPETALSGADEVTQKARKITVHPRHARGFAGAVRELETSSADLSDERLPNQQPDDPGDGPYIIGLFGKPIPVSRLKTRRRRFGRRR